MSPSFPAFASPSPPALSLADETQQCADAATEHVRFLEEKLEGDRAEAEAAAASLQAALEGAQAEAAAAGQALDEARAQAAAELEAAAEAAAAELVRVQVGGLTAFSAATRVAARGASAVALLLSMFPFTFSPPVTGGNAASQLAAAVHPLCCTTSSLLACPRRRQPLLSATRCWPPSGAWKPPRASWSCGWWRRRGRCTLRTS
jgi:hypothetical protein